MCGGGMRRTCETGDYGPVLLWPGSTAAPRALALPTRTSTALSRTGSAPLRIGDRPGHLDVRSDARAFQHLAIDLETRHGHIEQIAARHGEGARGADRAGGAGSDQRTLALALVGMHEQLRGASRMLIDENGASSPQRGHGARRLGLVARTEQGAARVEEVQVALGIAGRAADPAAHVHDQTVERRWAILVALRPRRPLVDPEAGQRVLQGRA